MDFQNCYHPLVINYCDEKPPDFPEAFLLESPIFIFNFTCYNLKYIVYETNLLIYFIDNHFVKPGP